MDVQNYSTRKHLCQETPQLYPGTSIHDQTAEKIIDQLELIKTPLRSSFDTWSIVIVFLIIILSYISYLLLWSCVPDNLI